MLLLFQLRAQYYGSGGMLDAYLDPTLRLPEAEPEGPAVLAGQEGLEGRHDLLQQAGPQGEGGEGGQQPAVPQLALAHVEPQHLADNKGHEKQSHLSAPATRKAGSEQISPGLRHSAFPPNTAGSAG